MSNNRPIEAVVAVIPRGRCLLAIRRSTRVVAPRMVCFPGGRLEADEPEVDGLKRELREELAVTVEPIRRLWTSVTPWEVGLAWWLCAPLTHEPRPNPEEVESVHWLEPGELGALPDLLESNRTFLEAWRRGAFPLPG